MQWFIIRRFVELALLSLVLAPFQGCHDFGAVLDRFLGLSELDKIGLIACVLIIATGIAETFIATRNWMVELFRSSP